MSKKRLFDAAVINAFMDKFLTEYKQQIPQNPVLELTNETKG